MAFRKLQNHGGCYKAQLFRLQLHQDSSYTSHVASYGRWVSDRLWEVWDSVVLWEAHEQRRAERQVPNANFWKMGDPLPGRGFRSAHSDHVVLHNYRETSQDNTSVLYPLLCGARCCKLSKLQTTLKIKVAHYPINQLPAYKQ
jgi:hypothetical protein